MSQVSASLVYYFGRDEELWRNLRHDMIAGSSCPLQFGQIIDKKNVRLDVLACYLANHSPRLLLIDFSMPLKEILRLVFNLKAEFQSQNVSIVGLFDSLESRILLKKALSLGVQTALVKELGTLELSQSLLDLLQPERVLNKLKDKNFNLEAQNLLRLGYVGPDYIHLESSWRFTEGENIHLETAMGAEFDLPLSFKILRSGDKNIYSPAKFWQDIEPVYQDEYQMTLLEKRLKTYKGLLEKTPKNKKLHYEVSLIQNDLDLLIKKAHKAESEFSLKVKRWMNSNQDSSRPKRTRVLVIDSKMRLLAQDKELLDSFSYSLRCYSKLHDDEKIIRRILPGIIFIQWENTGRELETLGRLIRYISNEENYQPLIALFHCPLTLTDIKNQFSYSAFLIRTQDLCLAELDIVAKRYEKSLGHLATYGVSNGDREDRFYISKYDERSLATFVMDFQVKKMGERAIVFTSSRPIPHQSVFYIKYPFKMSLTVFRCSDLATNESLGLIHGIGKEEKEQLLQIWEDL